MLYEFGPYRLDDSERLLLRDGKLVPLTPKSFDTLLVLVQSSGHLLDKEELMKRIWPDSFVEEATLAQNIFTIRRILGETPGTNRYIETVPRRGYRFLAEVHTFSAKHVIASAQTAKATGPRSIAVLPFRMLGPSDRDEYFGLGMADALITKLSNIGSISVRPTTSVLKYASVQHDPIFAGYDLKVDLVLEGKVQRLGNRIRVTVQLLLVESGAPIWADKFDCEFVDLFAVQDSISAQVVDALTLQLTTHERKILAKHFTTNSDSYQEYLKGRYQWNRWTQEGFEKSIKHFERAIEIEPAFALAYAGAADAHSALAFYGHSSPHLTMPQVKLASEKSLELDETIAEAHLSLGYAFLFYDWNWTRAEREFRRAIDLNPTYAMTYQSLGTFLTAMGRFEEAVAKMNRALELDPVSPLISTTAGFPHYFAGDYDKAIERYLAALDIDPNFGLVHTSLGDAYLEKGMLDEAIAEFEKAVPILGRTPAMLSSLASALAMSNQVEEAREILNELVETGKRHYVSAALTARIHLALGDKDSAVEDLRRGLDERSSRMVFLKVQPYWLPLHSDPRFIDLLEHIGLN